MSLLTFCLGSPSSAPPSAAPTPRIVDTSSNAAVSLVRGWLGTCMAEHKQCNIRARTLLPSRLVDVSNHRVRLADTEGKEGAYLALSHCWGRNQIVQTKDANIAERMEDIPWDLLSKTFQDAIIFTWKLGYRYIWIDSLVSHRQPRLNPAPFSHCIVSALYKTTPETGKSRYRKWPKYSAARS
jgi:hypothetical protein